MARAKTYTKAALADRALLAFWSNGYYATSMDDLVQATKVSRHGIYQEFGGKKQLFLACFEFYQKSIVSPAFKNVEKTGANLQQIADYFEHQIALAESTGLPGPGCFVANSATEVAPHDSDIKDMVELHNQRLQRGFINALQSSNLSEQQRLHLANTIVIFATGLWSLSRNETDASKLRSSVVIFMEFLERYLK